LVPGLAEVERNREVVLGGIEFRAILRHADGLYLVVDAEGLQQGHVERQQGFADVESGMALLLGHDDVPSTRGEQGGDGGTRRAAAQHEYVAVLCGRVVVPGRS